MDHLSVTEAAEALALSVPTIKRYIYDGKLRSVKLPGGQHRIPRSEIDRLLSTAAAAPAPPDAEALADRVAVLERWVTELQAEIERLTVSLEVVARYCARSNPEGAACDCDGTEAANCHRIFILGPGCRRCDALYTLTLRVLQSLGYGDVPVERVKNMDDIAAFGPILTPALVVDNRVIAAGRIPNEVALRDLLRQILS